MDGTAAAARCWDRLAGGYDRATRMAERRWFGPARAWLVPRAHGDVLEVAVGTGANLVHYARGVRLTATDVSAAMLELARRRADGLGLEPRFEVGDAARLAAPDAAFDAAVCTFALCAVPDERTVLGELGRVLRPGGLLLLADHVESSSAPVRGRRRHRGHAPPTRRAWTSTRRPEGTAMSNLVVHFEIHASEPQTLIDFYQQLLGWTFTQFGSQDYWVIDTGEGSMRPPARTGGGINGGLVRRMGARPEIGGPVTGADLVIGVDGVVDDVFARGVELGAVVALPLADMAGIGRLGYLVDPDGNVFGLISPVLSDGTDVMAP